MDWPTFNRILDEANSLGVNEIAFSGGEPLLWGNIEKAISRSLELGIHTILYTTGNAPNAEMLMGNLHVIGLDRVIFSIFGTDSGQHEAVTSKKDGYTSTIGLPRYC